MRNTNSANTDTNTAVLNTLELIGADIARQWKSITKGQVSRFNQYTKAGGFDMTLGNLMVTLSVEGSGRIKSSRLVECGINIVDKRRRAEAMWFVNNEVDCREFIAKSKRGYTSLTSLQLAMSKVDNDSGSTDKPEASGKLEPAHNLKVDATPETSEAKVYTKETIFRDLIAICKESDVDIMDIAEMLLREADEIEVDTPDAIAA